MAITLKTITGKIVIPGTTIGIRAKVTAAPMTNAQALTFPIDDVMSWGPVEAVTDANGNLPTSFKIPTNSAQQDQELVWRFTAEPIDKHAGLPKSWLMGHYTITGTGTIDLADLVNVDITAIPTAVYIDIQALIANAGSASASADSAAASATSSAASATSAAASASVASTLVTTDLGTTDGQSFALVTDSNSLTGSALVGMFATCISVKDHRFGAVGDGTTDDTAAIQAALNAIPLSGGALYFPAGTYKVSAALTVTKPCVIIGSDYGSDVKTSSATANVFTVSGMFVSMREIRITSSVTRTAGWYVDVLSSASRFRIENFHMDGAIGGIRSAAVATCTIDHGMILNCTAGTGVAVRIDAGVDVTINDLLVDAGAQIYSGVYITNAGDVQITDCQLIHAGDALRVDAGVGDVVASVWSSDTFYDNSTNGVVLNAAGGSIVRSRFTSCWMSSSTEWGVKLASSAGGSIDGTDILGCHVFLNGSGGIVLNDPGVHNTRIADSAICENTGDAGILINAAVIEFSIIGNRIGDGYGFAGNGYGIYFNSAAADYFQISNNDLTGNTVAAITGTPTAAANSIISNNLGDQDSGFLTGVTVTASPFTYTAGPRHENVYINGGTVSLVKVNGAPVFQQTNCTVRLTPGESLEITYTAAPGVAATKD